jgi:hypothetical protein
MTMPKFNLTIDTNEIENPDRCWGSWTLTVIAGLDEEPEKILSEALDRVKGAVNALPPYKRYPRHHANAFNE